jgi:RNA polymerase sigma factor (sigma-70 family)
MESKPSEQARWFAEEVQVHERSLRGYVRDSFPWLRDVDDLVQESYLRLFRARSDTQIRSPRSLLFATARNAALDIFRRRKLVEMESLTENPSESVLMDNGRSAAEIACLNQEIEILAEAIRRLPDRCRQVLTLRRIYGLPQKEIAARLGITENTVEAQMGIGLRRCGEYLRRHGVLKEHGRLPA